MGGMAVLSASVSHQTLPVIQRCTSADKIRACLKPSGLWMKVEKFSLKMIMRVHLHYDVDSRLYVLKISDGCLDADAEVYILLSRDFNNLVEKVDLIS
ncbi:ATP-dependent DNA helicase [Trichonephila clavipes]|nr:ATP-dependent DNA helicase [Trichonephila clavipes]